MSFKPLSHPRLATYHLGIGLYRYFNDKSSLTSTSLSGLLIAQCHKGNTVIPLEKRSSRYMHRELQLSIVLNPLGQKGHVEYQSIKYLLTRYIFLKVWHYLLF